MNNLLQWTSALVNSLYENGVRHVIISPGSRSTPLTIAAALHPKLQTKVILDERSAAFIALGIGKQTGIPAALICTSGTAAANYFPAVIEAKESGVPIIILSADRPPHLRGIGSSQTVDQLKLFGGQTVFFHEAGEPQPEKTDLKRVEFLSKQAVETSIYKGGASHINLPFRKPLEPDETQAEAVVKWYQQKTKKMVKNNSPSDSAISYSEELTETLASCSKPLIIAGPSDPYRSLEVQVQQLSEYLAAPVLSEPGSNIPGSTHINRYEQFLRDPVFLKNMKPDFILRFGDQPFTKSLLTALDEWQEVPTLLINSRNAWQDHAMSANFRILCRSEDSINLSDTIRKTDSSWFSQWKEAEKQADATLRSVLSEHQELSDGHIFYHLKSQLGDNWNVMLSNSFPARDMALFAEAEPGQFVNRGAAGIDGIMSTGLGIHFSSDKPTCCITGDLAFLHDSNALLSLKYSKAPFVIVVVNNGGGTIFRMLPVHQQQPQLYETYFETPQPVDIRSLAGAYNIDYQKISMVDELLKLDLNSVIKPLIVECITSSGLSMEIRKKLWND